MSLPHAPRILTSTIAKRTFIGVIGDVVLSKMRIRIVLWAWHNLDGELRTVYGLMELVGPRCSIPHGGVNFGDVMQARTPELIMVGK